MLQCMHCGRTGVGKFTSFEPGKRPMCECGFSMYEVERPLTDEEQKQFRKKEIARIDAAKGDDDGEASAPPAPVVARSPSCGLEDAAVDWRKGGAPPAPAVRPYQGDTPALDERGERMDSTTTRAPVVETAPGVREAELDGVLSLVVEMDPERMSGQPCIGGTRMPIAQIINMFLCGMTMQRVLDTWRGRYPYSVFVILSKIADDLEVQPSPASLGVRPEALQGVLRRIESAMRDSHDGGWPWVKLLPADVVQITEHLEALTEPAAVTQPLGVREAAEIIFDAADDWQMLFSELQQVISRVVPQEVETDGNV